MLVVTELFNIAVNDFDGKKSAFSERILVTVFVFVGPIAGADPGGPWGPGPPLDPRFRGPKIEHFWALFNFSIIFFCLASLGILFL